MVTAARAVRVKAHPFFRSVKVEKPALTAGQDQSIRITIKNPVQEVVILSAFVTYPDGKCDNLATGTTSTTAELRWRIPEAAVAGPVRFSLSAGSGGCCGGDPRKRNFGTITPFEGSFDLI
jgi:hypothetical protein